MELDRLFRGTNDIRAHIVNVIFRMQNWPRPRFSRCPILQATEILNEIDVLSTVVDPRNIASVENSILYINNIANNVKSEWSHFVFLRHLDVEYPDITSMKRVVARDLNESVLQWYIRYYERVLSPEKPDTFTS